MKLAPPCPVPDTALHARYLRVGGYADAYALDIERDVTHAELVEAFYTTWLFKLERFILKWLVDKPSTDAEARALARGERAAFAAWTLEATAKDELLMQDFQGRTRSWLSVAPRHDGCGGTRLLFGTGIAPVTDRASGKQRLGRGFSALLWFHRLYSRALLGAAHARLSRRR